MQTLDGVMAELVVPKQSVGYVNKSSQLQGASVRPALVAAVFL